MKTNTFLVIVFALFLVFVSIAFSGHFEKPNTSPIMMHLAGSLNINGEEAMPGDEVAIYDKKGNVLGAFVVQKEGLFGDIAITGNDELTSKQEGALNGDILEIKVWQKSTNRKYSGENINIETPVEGKAIYTPYSGTLLRFEASTFYLLNIEVAEYEK